MFELPVDIPNHANWETKPLGKICSEVRRGSAPVYVEKSNVKAIGQRCVTHADFNPAAARPHSEDSMGGTLLAFKGDVLLNSTGTGTIGRSCVYAADGTFVVDGHVTLLRPVVGQADSRWLNALIRSTWFQTHMERFCYTGSTNQLELSRLQLASSSVPVPSEFEQAAMGDILDTLDTQIRQTEAIIAKLQQVKQGLLHDLLTRGIDENGQLRPPCEEAQELYKDSPLGWIPKEWEATELGNALSHIDAGRSPSCPDIPAPSGAWGVLKVSAVHPDGFKEQETKIVEQSVFHNPQLEVKDGDLLITRANTPELVGLPCLVSTDRDRLMLSDKTLRLNFKEGQNKAFFFYMLTQSWARSQIQVAATGTSMSMKNISQLSLKSLKVKQPPTTEQAKISQRVYEAGCQVSEEAILLEKIKKQKAGLMDDLLTGRVRVTELIEQEKQAS